MKFLLHFFNSLSSENIRYSVLRNYEELPYSVGESDLDILINKTDAEKFLGTLSNTAMDFGGGIVSFIDRPNCPRICVMGSKNGGWGLMVDLHYDEIAFQGYTILTNRIIWKYTFPFNGIVFALEPKANALVGLLKELMNNGFCREKYFTDFKQISLDKDFLQEVFWEIQKPNLIEVLMKSENAEYSTTEIDRLTQSLTKEFPKKRLISFKNLRKYNRLFRQPGYVIAVVGVANLYNERAIENMIGTLNAAFHKNVYLTDWSNHFCHRKTNSLKSERQIGTARTGSIKKDVHRVRKFLTGDIKNAIDFVHDFYSKIYASKASGSCVWLIENYEFIMNNVYIQKGPNRLLFKIIQLLIPSPDLIIYIDSENSIETELTAETNTGDEIRPGNEMRNYFKTKKNAVVIDTSQSIEITSVIVLDEVSKVMCNRFKSIAP